MPHAGTQSSKPLNKGDEMEMRVARLWFWEGYFSRCKINLQRYYHPEPLLVTDLDLMAYDFEPSLRVKRTIGEVKAGTAKNAQKPLDRIIWLRGLKEIVRAEHAELVSSITPSPRARKLAKSIGVIAQSQADIERRERLANVMEVEDAGAHGTRAFREREWVHRHCKSNPDLERAFWFLRSEVWFHDEITACKRLIGLYGKLGKLWAAEIEDEDSRAFRWLLAETVSVFTLNAVAVAFEAIRVEPELLAAELGEQLSAGLASADVMRRIAFDVDKYVIGLLTAANMSANVTADATGALHPEPPVWTKQFVEFISRLAANRERARLLPRQIDLIAHERIVWRREVNLIPYERLSLTDPEAGRLVRLVAAFLRGQVTHIEIVDRALSTALKAAGQYPSTNAATIEAPDEHEASVQASLLET